MSSDSSKYQVKVNHSEEEQFDVEHLSLDLDLDDINPSIPTAAEPSYVVDDKADATTAANALKVPEVVEDKDSSCSSCFNSNSKQSNFDFATFLMNNKTVALIATAALLSVGAIIGLSISGVVEQKHLQQQKALAAITGAAGRRGRPQTSSHSHVHSKTGKGGKSASASSCLSGHDPIDKDGQDFCGDDEVIECGATFTNEEVVLSHGLFCTENDYSDDEELMELNAAITLSGPDASIDCQGRTIRQISQGLGSSCFAGLVFDDPFAPSDGRKNMKKYCKNFYQAGILLINGATAINCNVENFYEGFLVLNGGEVRKSKTSGNSRGVFIQDLTGSFETMVSDVYAYDNHVGIIVYNNGSSNSSTIEGVTCELSYIGMDLKGPDILVRDSTASHNRLIGIHSVGPFEAFIEDYYTTKIQFEGKVSSHHNEYGINFSYLTMDFGFDGSIKTMSAEVSVKGEVNTYLNSKSGLGVSSNPGWDVPFTVEESGSWISCQNRIVDVVNLDGRSSFIDLGTDGYSCDTSSEEYEYIDGPWSATCVPCPACE